MEEFQKKEILESLKAYLRELITLYERMKEENLSLFNENERLKELNKQKEEEIQQLKQKLETYKLTNAFIISSEGEDISQKKHEAKIKINRIIKEIDRCIGMLNK